MWWRFCTIHYSFFIIYYSLHIDIHKCRSSAEKIPRRQKRSAAHTLRYDRIFPFLSSLCVLMLHTLTACFAVVQVQKNPLRGFFHTLKLCVYMNCNFQRVRLTPLKLSFSKKYKQPPPSTRQERATGRIFFQLRERGNVLLCG